MADNSLDPSITIVINGVNVSDEGTEEIYARTRQQMSAKRILRCKWLDRFKVITALQSATVQVGTVTLVVGGAQYPNIQNYFVDRIEVKGLGVLGNDQNQVAGYEWAVMTVTYSPLDFAAAQTEIDFGKDIITYPASTLKFQAGGGAVPAGISFPINVVTLRQSRYNLPSLPIKTILNATDNPLNSQSIFGASPGQVLFDGGKSVMRWNIANGAIDPTTGGTWNFDLCYSFVYRTIPWDQFLDVDGTYKKVVRQDGSNILGSSDLNALFL